MVAAGNSHFGFSRRPGHPIDYPKVGPSIFVSIAECPTESVAITAKTSSRQKS